MIYRITARFSDTEAAQKAARRISGITGEVYEIRLSYRGESEDSPHNNLVYAKNSRAVFPVSNGVTGYVAPLNSVEGISPGEISQECGMTVYCRDTINDSISKSIVNSGGYDIDIREEKPF